MGKLAVGQVVSCAFPFSDLKSRKLRPALVVAIVDFDDIILCQITSKSYSGSSPIKLLAADFAQGTLPIDSYIRPDKLFTADASIVGGKYGVIRSEKLVEAHKAIRALFVP